MQSEEWEQLTTRMRTQLETVHTLYEISAGFLSQMHTQDVIFLLLRSLIDQLPNALSTAFYIREEGDDWQRARIYVQPEARPLSGDWCQGEVWPEEELVLQLCREERKPYAVGLDEAYAFVDKLTEVQASQILYYPLVLPNSGFTGVVGVLLREARPLRVHQSALVQAIIQQGTVAFMHGALYEQTVNSETQMQAILESSRDGIILVSPEKKVHYLNRRAFELLSLDDPSHLGEDMTLVKLIELIDAELPDLADWLMTSLPGNPFSRSTATEVVEDTPVFTSRHGRAIKLQHWPVYVRSDQHLGSLYLLRDITEQQRLQRMRDDLLHMIVHDLRNPLSTIQNALDILQDPEMEGVGDEVIRIARTSADRMMGLVNAILEIGRLEAGNDDLQPESMPVTGFVEAITQEAGVSRQDVRIELQIPDGLPPLWVDPAIAIRIIDNLFSNALKFAKTPDGLIRVTATRKDGWAELCVYNNGPHIPPDLQKNLFHKFVTGENERRGYGLGLAFCQLAVEAHGGRIWSENHPEGGVSFCFTLPLSVESAPSEAEDTV